MKRLCCERFTFQLKNPGNDSFFAFHPGKNVEKSARFRNLFWHNQIWNRGLTVTDGGWRALPTLLSSAIMRTFDLKLTTQYVWSYFMYSKLKHWFEGGLVRTTGFINPAVLWQAQPVFTGSKFQAVVLLFHVALIPSFYPFPINWCLKKANRIKLEELV